MMKINAISALALFGTLLATPLTSSAETAEEKGLAIAIEGDKRDQGYIDSTSDMRMILRNRAGKAMSSFAYL